ncbi:MAG: hypothetical protein ABR597_06800 [Bacteroidales bacterium]
MKRKLLSIFLTFLGISLLSSCSRDDDKDFPFTHISLMHFENFTGQGRELVFYLETLEEFPCSNFQISAQVTTLRDYLEIQASNIDIPSYCVTAIGPATRSLMLGDPEQIPGSVSFWVNDLRHDFSLLLNDESIELVEEAFFDDRLTFVREKLMRIPDHTVWGYLVSDSIDEKIVIPDELMLMFEDAGAELLPLSEGDYHYFLAGEEQSVIFFPGGDDEIEGFTMYFEKDMEILADVFQEYLDMYDISHMTIRLFNTRGERFLL